MMEGRGGVAISDLIVKEGRRSSIYRSYVYPHLNRKNLTVMSGTLVRKLIVSGSSVLGVEVIKDSVPQTFLAAKEVILALGAIHTPKVLMQSGIGPKDELAKHGIRVVQHLPGVGQNHQDHIALSCVFAYREPQEMRNGGSEAALYWKTDPGLRQPDLFHCQAEFPVASAEVALRGLPSHGWSMFAGISHPKSRGSVRLSGPNVNDPVLIDANTLAHPDDLETALKTIELSQEIGHSAPFASLVTHEVFPGKLSKKDMEQYARDAAVTYWHQAGTAKMGRDELSVVDSSLKVYGIERLRIADASVMPEITSGNTMAPCVVIGERAAEMIKSSNGL
jgi:choline dehydrogenase